VFDNDILTSQAGAFFRFQTFQIWNFSVNNGLCHVFLGYLRPPLFESDCQQNTPNVSSSASLRQDLWNEWRQWRLFPRALRRFQDSSLRNVVRREVLFPTLKFSFPNEFHQITKTISLADRSCSVWGRVFALERDMRWWMKWGKVKLPLSWF
jgi:hypothetical protein